MEPKPANGGAKDREVSAGIRMILEDLRDLRLQAAEDRRRSDERFELAMRDSADRFERAMREAVRREKETSKFMVKAAT